MGEIPMTDGEYAFAYAMEGLSKQQSLERRIARLEEQVNILLEHQRKED